MESIAGQEGLWPDSWLEELSEPVKGIEKRLHLPDGFLDKLLAEDDWSFVIKAHALLESMCSEYLVHLLGNPSFSKALSRMELSDKYRGKMAFLEASGAMDKKERGFIFAMSTLRNDLVHDVRNTSFSFLRHVTSLDANQKDNFIESFGLAFYKGESRKVEGKDRDSILRNPKEAIWIGLQGISAKISLEIEILSLNREVSEKKLRMLEIDRVIQTVKSRIEKRNEPSD